MTAAFFAGAFFAAALAGAAFLAGAFFAAGVLFAGALTAALAGGFGAVAVGFDQRALDQSFFERGDGLFEGQIFVADGRRMAGWRGSASSGAPGPGAPWYSAAPQGEHPRPRGYCANFRVPRRRGTFVTTHKLARLIFGGLSGAPL